MFKSKTFKIVDFESDTIVCGIEACKAHIKKIRKCCTKASFVIMTGVPKRVIERELKSLHDCGMDGGFFKKTEPWTYTRRGTTIYHEDEVY